MEKPFTVALILPPPHLSPAPIVHGVVRFSSQRTCWRVKIAISTDPPYLKRFLKTCDGIISHANIGVLAVLRKIRIPTVCFLGDAASLPMPVVEPDEKRIGEMGAEHLLARGFQRFGFFGMPGRWSAGRQAGFVNRLARSGFTCLTNAKGKPPGIPPTWEELSARSFLPRWMRRLSPPAAVMAANDSSARKVIDVCQRFGWRVPHDIAVLGVDNDETVCNYAEIGLSSIDRNLEQIGFEAAQLLERLIAGRVSRTEEVFVPPLPLVTRQSTQAYAIQDSDAAAAARYIHEHACDDIDVRDVLKVIPVSRRALERKFLKAMRRTPAQEIRRVRLARACELLTGTDLSVSDIAAQCGFQYRTYLALAFKKEFGQTPRQYRQRARER